MTARAWVESRSPEARAAYQVAVSELGAARRDAVKMVEDINGGARYNDTNYIFPSYILAHLPRGLAGLVIAVIFAAAMSTLSGEFNSLATATVVDFYKRFVTPSGGDAHELLVSRAFTAFWGGFACLVALRAGQLGSAIEVVNRFGSYFYGSILGVFLLAVLTPRAAARGAFYGLMLGMAAVFAVSRYTTVHFLWYNVVGAVTVFVAGLVITALSAEPPPARPSRARSA
jgi:Na+/proline symporter